MFVSARQNSPYLSRGTLLGIPSAALVVCLLPTFQHAAAQAQNPTSAKAGRIYVATIYRLKPDGGEEDKTFHSAAIVAIDPATGDWQLLAENNPITGKGGGDAVRLSPDRRTLVFHRTDDGIWKCESDGQFPFKIFDQRGNWSLRPVWSADGKNLIATTTELIKKDSKEVPRTETWQIDPDGRNPVKLAVPDTDWVEDCSPDGQWFITITRRHPGQLCLMKTDGTQERKLTDGGSNLHARFSPDGKKILYRHVTNAEGHSIRTVDFDGANTTELIKEDGLTLPGGAFWSPDGKQIAVVVFDLELDENGQKSVRRLDTADYRIEIMDADGTNRRKMPLKGARFGFISAMGDWQ